MLISACDPIIGCISPPPGINPLPQEGGTLQFTPLVALLNIGFKLLFIVAGLYAFLNLVTAGFAFIGSGGDAKAVQAAWNKILQTFIGIIFLVASFLIAGILGQLLFGDPVYFLNPTLTIQ